MKDIYYFSALVAAASLLVIYAPQSFLTSVVLIRTGVLMLLLIHESDTLVDHRRYAAYTFIGVGLLLYFFNLYPPPKNTKFYAAY